MRNQPNKALVDNPTEIVDRLPSMKETPRSSAAERRFSQEILAAFALRVFAELQVPERTSRLAVRSLLDASLLGMETHGIEALRMYVDHLTGGGLKAKAEPLRVLESGGFDLWDMRSGFGLASGRIIMEHAISRAKESGIYLASIRNTNHIGACGVYGKIAADAGLIGMVSQQTLPAFAPWGGKEARVGASPFALVAPVKDMFPFYLDCSMAAVTRAKIKACRLAGVPLEEGLALDADGNPTADPEAAWFGQLMPIGRYKGVGLAMAFEILSAVLSGNQFADTIPSIVNEPHKSADSSVFMMAIDPQKVASEVDFPGRIREYVEYVESSPAKDHSDPPRYPGRREGEIWADRTRNGIPVTPDGLGGFETIAEELGVRPLGG